MKRIRIHRKNYSRIKKNKRPVKKTVEIYACLKYIVAWKGKKSNFPGQLFRHKFSRHTKARVLGLPNGDLLITGKKNLWNDFYYKK